MKHFDPATIQRPDPALFRYYIFVALLSGPLVPVVFLPLWFRYVTLRYKFDDTGVSMCWGILFRREIYLTYRRIQDIHLTRNVLQRWMGLAKISLQTASGSSQAEMVIEGVLEAEELRDYLYSRMRGARGDVDDLPAGDVGSTTDAIDDTHLNAKYAVQLLEEIRDALSQHANSLPEGNRTDGSG